MIKKLQTKNVEMAKLPFMQYKKHVGICNMFD